MRIFALGMSLVALFEALVLIGFIVTVIRRERRLVQRPRQMNELVEDLKATCGGAFVDERMRLH